MNPFKIYTMDTIKILVQRVPIMSSYHCLEMEQSDYNHEVESYRTSYFTKDKSIIEDIETKLRKIRWVKVLI